MIAFKLYDRRSRHTDSKQCINTACSLPSGQGKKELHRAAFLSPANPAGRKHIWHKQGSCTERAQQITWSRERQQHFHLQCHGFLGRRKRAALFLLFLDGFPKKTCATFPFPWACITPAVSTSSTPTCCPASHRFDRAKTHTELLGSSLNAAGQADKQPLYGSHIRGSSLCERSPQQTPGHPHRGKKLLVGHSHYKTPEKPLWAQLLPFSAAAMGRFPRKRLTCGHHPHPSDLILSNGDLNQSLGIGLWWRRGCALCCDTA